jgi:SAM-dependent methyltransferase
VDLLRPHLAGRILELGAGHGTFTAELAAIAPIDAVEPSAHAVELLKRRFDGDERVRVVQAVVEELPDEPRYGSAVMVNVLEHIEDDAGALGAIRRRLRPGAQLAIWLLYSEFDRKLGHHRRYRRPQLETLVRSAGYEVVRSQYVNMPGWFSWLLISRLLNREPTSGPLVRIFDRWLVPAIRIMEARVRPPFGQSILLVGRAT